MQAQLRYWEYFDMTDTFDNLYQNSKEGKRLDRLYGIITSRNNILLAYRTIKKNTGSNTSGADGRTIKGYQELSENELVQFIRNRLNNYQPMKVKRVFIPKPDGGKRPLGIPSMSDRIIQQAFKQVLEPICETKFYGHSYGFRPLRSTKHALERTCFLIKHSKYHFAVDIDIEGFFDNVNHNLLIKQLWNIGIKDRIVLKIIRKMLKAEISNEGIPNKGTPQGGILSPLLSNVVLNDLDQWIAGQWEKFESYHPFTKNDNKYKALRKTSNLKEGFIVRYADDFKILCKDYDSANRWFHAVKLYLKDRLKLNISPHKSKIVNLRKRKTEFPGFEIKAIKKGKQYVTRTRVTGKKKSQYIKAGKERIKAIQKEPTRYNVYDYNSWVLGIQNYSKGASFVNKDLADIQNKLRIYTYNRLKRVAKYETPKEPPPTYKRLFKNSFKTYKIDGTYMYPIADVQFEKNRLFTQKLIPYTSEGRHIIHKRLDENINQEINKLMKDTTIKSQSVEYFDNRISRYSMKKGKCEITNTFLMANMIHCHHFIPKHLGGTDKFMNLRILSIPVHKLIHATKKETISKYLDILKLDSNQLKKVNRYRKMCGLEPIS